MNVLMLPFVNMAVVCVMMPMAVLAVPIPKN